MVLKQAYITFLFAVVLLIPSDGTILTQYQTRIQKEIVKAFDVLPESFFLTELEFSFSNIEVYRIENDHECMGFLFIKEVKACSLNGCVAKELLNDNLGSEYFDISVITDPDFNVMSIKVLEYFSDYGYEIASKRYLKQYRNKNICSFSMESPQVDGISGATISYNGLIGSLEEFCSIQNTISTSAGE